MPSSSYRARRGADDATGFPSLIVGESWRLEGGRAARDAGLAKRLPNKARRGGQRSARRKRCPRVSANSEPTPSIGAKPAPAGQYQDPVSPIRGRKFCEPNGIVEGLSRS